jgi:hypothetical protein
LNERRGKYEEDEISSYCRVLRKREGTGISRRKR